MKNRIGFKRLYLGCDCMSPIQECPIPPPPRGGTPNFLGWEYLLEKFQWNPGGINLGMAQVNFKP